MTILKKVLVISWFGSFLALGALSANEGVFFPSGKGIYMEAEYFPVWADHVRDVGMVFTADSAYNMTSTLLASDTNNGSPQNGARLSFRVAPNKRADFEFRYTGFIHWRYNKYFTSATSNLFVPLRHFISQLNYYDWADLDVVNVHYSERLWLYELLIHYYLTPRDVDYFSFGITGGGAILADNNATYYDSQKVNQTNNMHFLDNNRLYGAKIGGLFQYRATKRFHWNIPVAFGMYANMVTHYQYGTRNNGAEAFTNKKRTRQYPSYTIEANPQIYYNLGPMYFVLGYQYLGVFNMAYSSMQTSFNRISWHGDLQSQSGQVGFGIHW